MKAFVISIAINGIALWVANALWDGLSIHGWAAYIIGAAVLGLANVFIKPVLTILALPLVVLTLGFFLLLINMAMIALAAWIAPNFEIHSFWTYVGTVVVVWLVNAVGYSIVERFDKPRRGRSQVVF